MIQKNNFIINILLTLVFCFLLSSWVGAESTQAILSPSDQLLEQSQNKPYLSNKQNGNIYNKWYCFDLNTIETLPTVSCFPVQIFFSDTRTQSEFSPLIELQSEGIWHYFVTPNLIPAKCDEATKSITKILNKAKTLCMFGAFWSDSFDGDHNNTDQVILTHRVKTEESSWIGLSSFNPEFGALQKYGRSYLITK